MTFTACFFPSVLFIPLLICLSIANLSFQSPEITLLKSSGLGKISVKEAKPALTAALKPRNPVVREKGRSAAPTAARPCAAAALCRPRPPPDGGDARFLSGRRVEFLPRVLFFPPGCPMADFRYAVNSE